MTITVVIPTLDEATRIPTTLFHTMTLGFDQIIVVDGGSQDGTTDLVDTLIQQSHAAASQPSPSPQVTCVSTRPSRAHQMNIGASATTGEILLFLHADTLLPLHSRTAIEGALHHPLAIGGRFDVRFEQDRGWAWVISRLINLRSRSSGIATGDQAIFVRRTSFESVGGYTDIPIMEDIDLTHRLKGLGKIVAIAEMVQTSFRRWERAGPLKTILLMWALRFLFWVGVDPERLSQWYRVVR